MIEREGFFYNRAKDKHKPDQNQDLEITGIGERHKVAATLDSAISSLITKDPNYKIQKKIHNLKTFKELGDLIESEPEKFWNIRVSDETVDTFLEATDLISHGGQVYIRDSSLGHAVDPKYDLETVPLSKGRVLFSLKLFNSSAESNNSLLNSFKEFQGHDLSRFHEGTHFSLHSLFGEVRDLLDCKVESKFHFKHLYATVSEFSKGLESGEKDSQEDFFGISNSGKLEIQDMDTYYDVKNNRPNPLR